jgi:hypothetical protein
MVEELRIIALGSLSDSTLHTRWLLSGTILALHGIGTLPIYKGQSRTRIVAGGVVYCTTHQTCPQAYALR